jgi:hypothetical protein
MLQYSAVVQGSEPRSKIRLACAQNKSQSLGLEQMTQKQSQASRGTCNPKYYKRNTRCTRSYTKDLNGDTGLFPSQLGGIRDVAEVTQSDLKVPDVRITTFHGSLDFILFLLFIYFFLFFLYFLNLLYLH